MDEGSGNNNMRRHTGISALDRAMGRLRSLFCGRARHSLDRFSELLPRLRDGSATAHEFEEMLRICHRLKGSGGSVGFSSVSRVAGRMESILESVAAESDGPDPVACEVLEKGAALLSRLVRASGQGGMSPEEEPRYIEDFLSAAGKLRP
jgi:chemotaxis protein histidine kinase CheA